MFVRLKAWLFVRRLKRELRGGYFDTRLGPHPRTRVISIGNVDIVTAPRRKVHVYVDGVYCWLPILQRVRLRRAITKALINEADI